MNASKGLSRQSSESSLKQGRIEQSLTPRASFTCQIPAKPGHEQHVKDDIVDRTLQEEFFEEAKNARKLQKIAVESQVITKPVERLTTPRVTSRTIDATVQSFDNQKNEKLEKGPDGSLVK